MEIYLFQFDITLAVSFYAALRNFWLISTYCNGEGESFNMMTDICSDFSDR